ncbi:MAG: hypothetical protein VXV96_13950 [Bdellovibrionota bacterium]|nr:hypothetical protein [Bdellovibrionota bacterium]
MSERLYKLPMPLLKLSKKAIFPLSMKVILLSLTLLSLTSLSAKKYSYGVDEATTSTVTKESFHQHFFGVLALYQEAFLKSGETVVPMPEWDNPYLTAYTARMGEIIKLGFWGGMARIPGMNDDAVALITCHEVGHILGGYPYLTLAHEMYHGISSEGQADYFATRECLKKYFRIEEETPTYLEREFPKTWRELCQKEPSSSLEEAICLRSLNAIDGFKSVVLLLKEDQGSFTMGFSSLPGASETLFNSYPKNQCRMQTLLAGLFDQERPACWFVN